MKIKVLFICHGNICRSPMAEFMFKDMVKKAHREDEFYIESAATSREEIGNDIHPGTKNVLRRYGIPFGRHYARQITKEDYETFDYIICMDGMNVRNTMRILGDDKKEKVRKLLDRDVADPWYTGNFELAYNEILEGCEDFIKYLKESNKMG